MTFSIQNGFGGPLTLVVEPEGIEYMLPQKEIAVIKVENDDTGLLIRCSSDDEGGPCLAFWDDHGEYKIEHNGRNIIDLAMEKFAKDKAKN